MSENQPREDGGTYGEKVTKQDILNVFETASEPFLTSSEVAAALPIGRDAVYRRLTRLYENGIIGKKSTGARSVVWWLADDDDIASDRDPGGSAAPLRELAGVLGDDEDGAARVHERVREVRNAINDEVDRTRREVSERERQ